MRETSSSRPSNWLGTAVHIWVDLSLFFIDQLSRVFPCLGWGLLKPNLAQAKGVIWFFLISRKNGKCR